MEEEQQNRTEEPDSFRPKETSEEPQEEITGPKSIQTPPMSSLLPKALSAVFHPAARTPTDPKDPSSQAPADVERLRTELRDLRDQFNQMKTQHK